MDLAPVWAEDSWWESGVQGTLCWIGVPIPSQISCAFAKLLLPLVVHVAEMDDNIEQIKKDLHMFLYHLRLPAEVFVVPLVSTYL